jgi:uncharacterized membrane protein YGL010W
MDPRNRIFHSFGIPLIVLGVMGLLSQLHLGPLDLALVVAAAVIAYYAVIDFGGALLCLLVFAALYAIAVHLPWQLNLTAFVAGWVCQLVGHRIEGTKPKFLENLIYLLIGPLYIVEEIFGALVGGKKPA